MKKFLFTLATAMLAGGMFAGEFVGGGTEYFYMDDANVTENLGGTVQLNVKAHFEASVSAWQVDFGMYNENAEFISNVLPGGITVKTAAKGSDLTLTYTDDAGDEGTTSPSLQKGQENTRFIVASMEGNYWDPDGDGEFELEGVAKWGPGEYEQMWKMTFNIPADFTGGEIAIQTRPTSGFDNDPEVTTTAGEKAWYKFNLTVDGTTPELQDLTGTIVIGEPSEDGLVDIYYDGEEEVTLTVVVNGEIVELVDGKLQLVEGRNMIVVTAEADGYNSLSQVAEIEWTAPEPPQPPVTPEPTINFDEETFTLTVEGEGEIHVYVDGVEVEVPYTFEQGEEDAEYEIVVVAQVDGADPVTVTTTVTVPGTGGVTPPEPQQGYYIVLIDQFGNEVPVELQLGADGDYTTTYTFEYYPWGEFVWNPELSDAENEANRPDVPFYFLINGVRYGADEAMREAVLGYAMQNPLEEGAEGYYCVPVGYSYTLGVAHQGGNYYVYAAVSKQTGVDEINGEKAVAGVRYFNMAGQEMQEANGMTIVVTTYTDGTTSAVKVMK
jgi:hypothetical protein